MLKLLMAAFISIGFAFAEEKIKFVPVEAAHIFGKTSEVKLSVAGYLPNGCYSKPYAKVERNSEENRIVVKILSNVQVDVMCTQAIRPYCMIVSLGAVGSEKYDVVVQPRTRWEKFLTINRDYKDSSSENISSLVLESRKDRFFCSPSSRSSNM